MAIKYTAYGDLKEGDEFIRVGHLPMLLTDARGTRIGNEFIPQDFGYGKPLEIRKMIRMPAGFLREIDLTDIPEDETFEERKARIGGDTDPLTGLPWVTYPDS